MFVPWPFGQKYEKIARCVCVKKKTQVSGRVAAWERRIGQGEAKWKSNVTRVSRNRRDILHICTWESGGWFAWKQLENHDRTPRRWLDGGADVQISTERFPPPGPLRGEINKEKRKKSQRSICFCTWASTTRSLHMYAVSILRLFGSEWKAKGMLFSTLSACV